MKIYDKHIISICMALSAVVSLGQATEDHSINNQESYLRSLKKKDKKPPVAPTPVATPVPPAPKGVFPKTSCPSAITLIHPEKRSKEDTKCSRGPACQTRFDPARKGNKLIGNDILSTKGLQKAFTSRFPSGKIKIDKIYDDAINKCLTRGPAAIHYDFELNTVPFQEELVDLCICLLSGGSDCDRACNCGLERGFLKLPFAGTFCDCYCACCKPE